MIAAQLGSAVVLIMVVGMVQGMLMLAPSPADDRGRPLEGPVVGPVLVTSVLATVLAARPSLLVGAEGTRAGAEGQVTNGVLAGVVPAVAAGVLATLVAQLMLREGRPLVARSVARTLLLVVAAALASGWIAAAAVGSGAATIAVCAVAATGAGLVRPFPTPAWLAWLLALSAAAIVAAVAAAIGGPMSTGDALFLGPIVGAVTLLGQLVGRWWTQGRRHAAEGRLMPAVVPVALLGPWIYLGARLVAAGG